ncbi:MAG: DUF4147 domain-containing protein [Gemmatimonadaceae bacterium]
MPDRLLAERLYHAGVAAADPFAVTRAAIDASALGARTWILAAGKGSVAMARGALDALQAARRTPIGGLVVAHTAQHAAPPLHLVVGDHPVPGTGSQAASDALARTVSLVKPGDDVLVLISGGATSLLASPVEGLSPAAMHALFEGMLASGAAIGVLNAFRKRVLRWGAGRLAASLAGARVHNLIASDVIGDDVAAIASGPCVADPLRAADLVELAQRLQLWPFIPHEVRDFLDDTLAGRRPETPKSGDLDALALDSRIILSNASALDGIAGAARGLGMSQVHVAPHAVEGFARETGDVIARAAVAYAEANPGALGAGACLIWGGETTVRLGDNADALGGRSQELALAAARVLAEGGAAARRVTILAAGTDGRDGPTDAAGAVVDAGSWGRIAAAGRDPLADLDAHRSYHALDAGGTLLRPGSTGTNVNDVVIALVD